MKSGQIVGRVVFYLIISTVILAVLIPFLAFLATAVYSSNEVYEFPRSIVPRLSYDVMVDWDADKEVYDLSIWEKDYDTGEEGYNLKIYSAKAEKLRRYLATKYSVQIETDEDLLRQFEPAKSGQALYITYKKDLLYNFKTFFSITSGADVAVWNSLKAAGWTIIISLTFGSIAGYSLARYKMKGKKQINMSLLLVRMFPSVAIALPMLVILYNMGLNNTMFGLALVYSIANIALTAWITSSIFQGISVELEEASLVFGANRITTFFRITLPLAFPGLVACSMYAFLAAWNDSITALILSNANPTLSLLIYKAVGNAGEIQLSAAGAIILITPALIFTYIIKNYINQLWGDVKI